MPQGKIVALLGANGAGKSTTLKSISNLLRAERGDVTKGSVEFKGQRIDQLTPADLVKKGVIQVMEGRHCFGHLSIEENLLTGAYTRSQYKSAAGGNVEPEFFAVGFHKGVFRCNFTTPLVFCVFASYLPYTSSVSTLASGATTITYSRISSKCDVINDSSIPAGA